MKIVGFLDDDPQFHRQKILGQTVYDPRNIERLIISKNIEIVLYNPISQNIGIASSIEISTAKVVTLLILTNSSNLK